MTDELSSVVDFLKRFPPFDTLEPDKLEALSREVTVQYARKSETILESGQNNDRLFIVRTGSMELRLAGEALTARLGEGACFAYPSLLRGGEVHNSVTAIEDSLLYTLPADAFHRLRHSSQRVHAFFAESEATRIRHALNEASGGNGPDLDSVTLDRIARSRRPVTCAPETTIREAVKLMADENVSTLAVVCEEGLSGIFTDKDLRTKVVAADIALTREIREVMTSDPLTLPMDANLSEAMASMASGGFRHIPLLDAHHELVAILSATDILAYLGNNAIDTGMAISRAISADALAHAAARIPESFAGMVQSGFRARHAMRFTSALGEAAHRRAAELAEVELGPPPVAYALVAFGSLARGEQLVGSDQDNGLILDDSVTEEGRRYFAELGNRISDHLNASGFVYCRGGIMAKNADQRLTVGEWCTRYRQWIERPSEDGILRSTIFFDMRSVHGSRELASQVRENTLKMAKESPLFISYLARDAQRSKIPLGIFRNLVLKKGEGGERVFDAKAQAIMPIVDIARTLALAHGVSQVATLERLCALADAGMIANEDAQSLEDAFLLVGGLRIEHQAALVRLGRAPDNAIAPTTLSPLERDYLKDAFTVIRRAIDSLRRNYAGGIA